VPEKNLAFGEDPDSFVDSGSFSRFHAISREESHAVARKPRDAAAVCFGLKFADIQYKFKSSQAPKVRLQSCRHTGANRI